jgi:hypothetical protein
MNPPKIRKLKVAKTAEQEDVLWAEVFSHKNKLLADSNWTQLPDSGLTPESAFQWQGWRQQLRNVTRANFSDRDAAQRAIDKLSKRQPFSTFEEDEIDPDHTRYPTLEEYRKRLMAYIDHAFEQKAKPTFLDMPVLVEEQFREALDFLSNPDANRPFPLIGVTAELYGMNRKAVADEFVERKVTLLKRLANLKQKYHYFQMLVMGAKTDVELAQIQEEVKKWILIST